MSPKDGMRRLAAWPSDLDTSFYRGVFRSVPSKVDWPSYDRVLNRTPPAGKKS